jgi:hypothetical protein
MSEMLEIPASILEEWFAATPNGSKARDGYQQERA